MLDDIQKILEGDICAEEVIDSLLMAKLAGSVNGICSAIKGIGQEVFSSSGVFTTPPNEVCWVIAMGYGGAGGGGGASPMFFNFGAATGDSGSPGSQGGNTTFNGVNIGEGGTGGLAGQFNVGLTTLPELHPFCECNNFTFGGSQTLSLNGGRGGYATVQSNTSVFINNGHRSGYTERGGSGHTGKFGIQIFKNLTPNTGYPVIVGAGGAAGPPHPIYTTQVDDEAGTTAIPAEDGDNGRAYIIYSGY